MPGPLPPVPVLPQGDYVPVRLHGGLAFVAGMTPRENGVLTVTGRVGADLDASAARQAAGIAARRALSALEAAAGGLDRVAAALHLTVYVAAVDGFTEHSAVADGASQALTEALGDRGRVARAAIGVASLPGGAPVEVSLLAAVDHGTGRAPAQPAR